jgi:Arc/MetJ family transcription regulator
MATNLAIDDSLINAAVKIGHHTSKKTAVTAALQEYIQHHKQQKILALFGQIDYNPDYDYKKERGRK